MKERPILFSAPMVRAILEGRKTQTRRVVKPQPTFYGPDNMHVDWKGNHYFSGYGFSEQCLYGLPGDRLWVRETWASCEPTMFGLGAIYRADPMYDGCAPGDLAWKWKPSIHMPRWASRINLEIVSVRVERLQEISEEDAIAEGIRSWGEFGWENYMYPAGQSDFLYFKSPKESYRTLWESINGPGSWDINPWVWVVEFRRVPQ